MVKITKFILVSGLMLSVLFFLFNEGRAQPLFRYEGGNSPKPGTSAPVIKYIFAVDKGPYGYIWKIYMEAEDPDGDMLKIGSVVEQVGYGNYPVDWIYLKGPNQKHLRGYIQWNTFSARTQLLREWTQIILRVSIIDRAGNESNVMALPFEFTSGVKGVYQYKLPPPFDQGNLPRLGYVHIDLFEPTLMGNGEGRED